MNRPQTVLQRSWRRACGAVGAADPGDALLERLLVAYREPQRRYHTLRHLGDCIALFEAVESQAAHPGEVCPAKWKEGEKTLAPSLDLVGKI